MTSESEVAIFQNPPEVPLVQGGRFWQQYEGLPFVVVLVLEHKPRVSVLYCRDAFRTSEMNTSSRVGVIRLN